VVFKLSVAVGPSKRLVPSAMSVVLLDVSSRGHHEHAGKYNFTALGEGERERVWGFHTLKIILKKKFSPGNSPSVVKVKKLYPFESSTTPSNYLCEMPVGSMCTCASDNPVNSAPITVCNPPNMHISSQFKMSFGRKLEAVGVRCRIAKRTSWAD